MAGLGFRVFEDTPTLWLGLCGTEGISHTYMGVVLKVLVNKRLLGIHFLKGGS